MREAVLEVSPKCNTADQVAYDLAFYCAIAKFDGIEIEGTMAAKKSLLNINRKIEKLLEALQQMTNYEMQALKTLGRPQHGELMETVAGVNEHIVAVYNHISALPIIGPRPRNAPKKKTPLQVARYAARTFAKLTGRPATRSVSTSDKLPSFVEFLSEIFQAAGIDKSADHYARLVVEESRQKIIVASVTA